MAARDDFSTKIKRLLSDRVGGRCTFPGCNQDTSGPDLIDTNRRVNTGVAAHITAAAPGGPRFDPDLTSEERRSINNGIWCCEYHARLIDADHSTYSSAELKRWKEVAEANQHERQKHPQNNVYSSQDIELLKELTDLFNFNYLQKLVSEPFREFVSNDVLEPLDQVQDMEENPYYSFNNFELEAFKLELFDAVSKFWELFRKHSAGNHYINIPSIRSKHPEMLEHFYNIIDDTRLLALNVKKSAMPLLQIRRRL